MAEVLTRGDSFKAYLTGASSHGGAQADPDLSLGKRVSSSSFVNYGLSGSDIITLGSGQVTIADIAGANGPGTGVITAVDSNTLNWTPPGGSAGANVAIASGETKILEGGGTGGGNKWIKVFRSDPGAMSSSGNVGITRPVNNVTSLDRVTSAELAAGDTEYRCIAIKCQNAGGADSVKLRARTQGTAQVTGVGQLGASGAGTITTAGSFADWPTQGYAVIWTNAPAQREIIFYSSRTGTALTVPAAGRGLLGSAAAAGAATDRIYCLLGPVAVGLDVAAIGPTPTFEDETGTGEGTAPSGPTFTVPLYDSANSIDARISVGDMDDGDYFGMWVKRQIVAGMASDPGMPVEISIMGDVA